MESRQPIAVALALQCLRNKEKFFNFPKKSCGAKNKGSKVHHSILFGSLHHFRLGAAAGSKVVDFESDKFGNPFIQKILQNYLRSPIAKNKGSKVHHSILFGSLHHFSLQAVNSWTLVATTLATHLFKIQKILQNHLHSPIVCDLGRFA